MPRTQFKTSDDLSIEVEDFKARYVPGDVIQGHVVRRRRSEHRPCSVQLIVFGRIKSKFVSTDHAAARNAEVRTGLRRLT